MQYRWRLMLPLTAISDGSVMTPLQSNHVDNEPCSSSLYRDGWTLSTITISPSSVTVIPATISTYLRIKDENQTLHVDKNSILERKSILIYRSLIFLMNNPSRENSCKRERSLPRSQITKLPDGKVSTLRGYHSCPSNFPATPNCVRYSPSLPKICAQKTGA